MAPVLESVDSIRFIIDGHEIEATPGETILQAADRAGVRIPRLCYTEGMRVDGNCRACVVEIEGERVLAPACARLPEAGLVVHATSARARHSQKLVLELLLSDMPAESYTRDSELDFWARELGVGLPRFAPLATAIGPVLPPDFSHPAISVRLAACIQCTRCVRACREVQVNDVIGYAGRGADARIVFDLGDPMGDSTCVTCGECVDACPTGAILPAHDGLLEIEKRVPTVCPYCGVGCQLSYHVHDDVIVRVTGRDGPSNHGRLCVKGRYGYDYVRHPDRLTAPLIRREGVAKRADELVDPSDPWSTFREASWDEALDRAAEGLRRIREQAGPDALASLGTAKGSNEEAYLLQKLVRIAFGTNNLDHCARLCHSSSVAAMLEMLGSAAGSNPVSDVQFSDVIVVAGSNTTQNHPVSATFLKNAVERGVRLIVLDPRRPDLARFATHFLQFRPGTDAAVLNAMMHVVIAEGLTDEAFIADRTEGIEALRDQVADYTPEVVERICGVAAGEIRAAARLFGMAKSALVFWGMGISQHVHGTDNARCIVDLALIAGQVGRRGAGLHPLRGQNNVQGASDMGLLAPLYPGYLPVNEPENQTRFEALWARPLSPRPGLTVVEMMDAALRGEVRGMYLMGENPAMSDPDAGKVREALASLDWMVSQEIFLTETASFADVILPASALPEKWGTYTNTDRRVQIGRPALNLPGDARQDWWILQEIAKRLGCGWSYSGPQDVFEEIRRAVPTYAGVTWARLERESAVTVPCLTEDDQGTEVLFTEGFPRPGGRARLVPVGLQPPAELPDDEYPFVLMTGRLLEQWHTGAMTRRSEVLNTLEPVPTASLHRLDLERLEVRPGDALTIESRRGRVVAQARRDDGVPRGAVVMPFAYVEAAANLLTISALDPDSRIPEYKYCAVRVQPGGVVPPSPSYAVTAGQVDRA